MSSFFMRATSNQGLFLAKFFRHEDTLKTVKYVKVELSRLPPFFSLSDTRCRHATWKSGTETF